MASDVAQHELVTSSLPADAPLTNGNHDEAMVVEESRNAEAFGENAAISKTDTSLDVSSVAPIKTDAAGPTPIEDVAPGIAPVADFIPKDAPTSHPTPPPDEPLVTSEANIDTEMTSTTDDAPQKEPTPAPEQAEQAAPVPVTTSNETSLVRPREEDEDGEEDAERAAKRSRTEDVPMQDAPVIEAQQVVVAKEDAPAVDEPSSVAPSGENAEPEVAKIETTEDEPMEVASTEAPQTTAPPTQSDVPLTNGTPATAVQEDSSPTDSKPVESEAKSSVEPTPAPASEAPKVTAAKSHQYSKDPITPPQLRFLIEKMKNLKKTKSSTFFLKPVDPVALNIPSYLDIIKEPMDLSTMEQKLKANEYKTVQEFADDFNRIVQNSIKFNGPNHVVSQAGMSMEAYFRKMMEMVPSSDQQQKAQAKKNSPKPPAPARRESRSAAVTTAAPPPLPAAPSTASTSEPFALQPDGTPQIRRESTTTRPARTIKPPPARELAYAKPKRKEHQAELKFVEMVLNQIKGPKFSNVNHVFQAPVDPVALNIPHYRQIVKHPMDLSTMTQKLKQGQYGRASEFRKDFELMISNCLAFNPVGNPVRDIGIQFQREFDVLWRTKESWEKKRKAEAARANSSAEEESAEEEEEEEEEEQTSANSAATIAALQKQLADMQNALATIGAGSVPAPKAKKAKAPKTSSKKGGASAPKATKAATTKAKPAKKPKQVTYEEKQEISEAVGNMNGPQVEELTRIITSNCKKYADQEEMELEIDDLPNDVQVLLLHYVRSIFGNPNKRARQPSPDDIANVDDDDFEPPARGARGGGGKRKKHKPMGKQEQQAAITNIQKQLAQFQNPGTSGSASPANSYPAQDADTSGDDESEESEEE